MMASSPPLLLAEEEVLEAFDCFVRASIGNAKARHLLANSWDGGEPGVSVTGPALCLYHAAMKSGTNPPSVAMPHYEGSGALQKRLNSSTCPAGFHHLFERWARMVPDILDLPRNNQYDLEKLLCDPPLGTPVQYHVASMDYPVTTLVHNIADALRSLAHDISYCRSYQQRQNPHIQPNMNTKPIAPPWPVPSMWSRDANLIEPATPHHENYVTQIGPHHYHNLQEQQYATHPNYMSPPPVGLAPSVLSPSPRPVTPVSYQGPFFPTGITGGPAPHIDSPRPTSVPVAFPAAQPFGTSETTPAVNLSRYNTIGPNYRLRSTHDVTASTERRTIAPIGAHTSMFEIINRLCSYDCQDLSKQLNHLSCSKNPISRGGFGEVYRGNLFDGREVAIKTMIINNHVTDDVQKHLKHAARELLVWSRCRHSNVARLLGLAMFREQIAMVSLWVENGDLRTYVNRHPNVDRIDLCTQVAAGLAHLHLIGIVHGDLKAANVLVSGEGVATLIDFGSAACEQSSLHFTKTKTNDNMSIRWAAPEILDGKTVSTKADVYALGMTALEVLTGSAPYNGLGDTAAITAVLVKKEFPVRPNNDILGMTERGNALWWLLVSCWVWTPSDRPTAEQVRISFEKIKELSQEYLSNASWYTQ